MDLLPGVPSKVGPRRLRDHQAETTEQPLRQEALREVQPGEWWAEQSQSRLINPTAQHLLFLS